MLTCTRAHAASAGRADRQFAQAHLGTALFASGAINTWRTETIVDVLLRHDTMHKGDDVQQGLILHCLAGKRYFLQPEVVHTGNYKVGRAPPPAPPGRPGA